MSIWIRILGFLTSWIWIRICDADPDPGDISLSGSRCGSGFKSETLGKDSIFILKYKFAIFKGE